MIVGMDSISQVMIEMLDERGKELQEHLETHKDNKEEVEWASRDLAVVDMALLALRNYRKTVGLT